MYVKFKIGRKEYELNRLVGKLAPMPLTDDERTLLFIDYMKPIIKSENKRLAQLKRHEKTRFEKWLNNYLFTNREFPPYITKDIVKAKFENFDWQHFENLLQTYIKNYEKQDEILLKRFKLDKRLTNK